MEWLAFFVVAALVIYACSPPRHKPTPPDHLEEAKAWAIDNHTKDGVTNWDAVEMEMDYATGLKSRW